MSMQQTLIEAAWHFICNNFWRITATMLIVVVAVSMVIYVIFLVCEQIGKGLADASRRIGWQWPPKKPARRNYKRK